MSFETSFAQIRFGCGLSPRRAAPRTLDAVFARLESADSAAAAHPITSFDDMLPTMLRERDLARQRRKGTEIESKEAVAALRGIRREMAGLRSHNLRQVLARVIDAEDGIRERLTYFWADHFTANGRGKGQVFASATAAYVDAAIRPRILGPFRELLIAAVTHPLMLVYLDQPRSFGPNSPAAARGKRQRGLNENLAREVLELHTLGVGGPYAQNDVRQLAELFTGLTFTPKQGFVFRANMAEPGAETILGQRYGGSKATLADIHAALADLAAHPDTARHIAWKLAVHFVSDAPDPALVDTLARRYMDTDGHLGEVTRALLEHPSSWDATRRNIKPPFLFIASTLRALGVDRQQVAAWKHGRIVKMLYQPMARMGQVWEGPAGPDGYAEEDMHWITPQGMAARLQWAMAAPQILAGSLPDPRAFVETALGPWVTPEVAFAAKAAETRWEGIALVLASPAFQRS